MTTHAEHEPAKTAEEINILSGNGFHSEDAVTALEHLVFSDGPRAVNTPSPVMPRDTPAPVTAVRCASNLPPDRGPRRSSARPRKRGRSSNDMSILHQDVRAILHATSPSLQPASSSQLSILGKLPTLEMTEAERLKTPKGEEMMERPDSARKLSLPQRLPVHKDLGRKRACCTDEVCRGSPAFAATVSRPRWQGPGMWEGVL